MDQETKNFVDGRFGALEKQIDTLAILVGNGFQRVETRLDGVETRLNGVETEVGGVKTRLDGMEARLSRVEEETHETKIVVMGLEHNLLERVEALEDGQQTHAEHIERIDKHVGLPHSLTV